MLYMVHLRTKDGRHAQTLEIVFESKAAAELYCQRMDYPNISIVPIMSLDLQSVDELCPA